jgi:hypothetical protein
MKPACRPTKWDEVAVLIRRGGELPFLEYQGHREHLPFCMSERDCELSFAGAAHVRATELTQGDCHAKVPRCQTTLGRRGVS